jgi:hypothetical protein
LTSAPWIDLLQDSDMVLLETWALLRDAMNRELDAVEPKTASIARLSAECRALETAIGATPRSRASLQWNGGGSRQPRRGLASVSNVSTGYTYTAAEMADLHRRMEEPDAIAE